MWRGIRTRTPAPHVLSRDRKPAALVSRAFNPNTPTPLQRRLRDRLKRLGENQASKNLLSLFFIVIFVASPFDALGVSAAILQDLRCHQQKIVECRACGVTRKVCAWLKIASESEATGYGMANFQMAIVAVTRFPR